jgi:tRNA pseudouridine55 synthase
MDGVLVVDKPEGPTSHDVVTWCRRRLGVSAVGHTGTLDPMATGVLVLVLGKATRLARFLSGQSKAYDATIRLGVSTDTWDRTGVAARPAYGGAWPSREAVEASLSGLAGQRAQRPPPFSAKKIGGERAHRLARRGEAVAIEPATVRLHACEIVEFEPPVLRVRLGCSAGFYVRSLAQEIGERLGCGACLERLCRTASGAFTLAEAADLSALDADPAAAVARLVPLERLLPEFPAVSLDEAGARRAAHGNEVAAPGAAAGSLPAGADLVRLLAPDGRLVAIARTADRPGFLHPAVVLQ